MWHCKNELISCQKRSIPRNQYINSIAYTLKQEMEKLNVTGSRIKIWHYSSNPSYTDQSKPSWDELLTSGQHVNSHICCPLGEQGCIPLLCPSDLSPGATFAGQLRTSDQHSLNRSLDWLVTEARGQCEHAAIQMLLD